MEETTHEKPDSEEKSEEEESKRATQKMSLKFWRKPSLKFWRKPKTVLVIFVFMTGVALVAANEVRIQKLHSRIDQQEKATAIIGLLSERNSSRVNNCLTEYDLQNMRGKVNAIRDKLGHDEWDEKKHFTKHKFELLASEVQRLKSDNNNSEIQVLDSEIQVLKSEVDSLEDNISSMESAISSLEYRLRTHKFMDH